MVPMHDHQVQDCGINVGQITAVDCMERSNEMMNEWVDPQQCNGYLFWDEADDQGQFVGGEEILPNSSNMGTMLSSFP